MPIIGNAKYITASGQIVPAGTPCLYLGAHLRAAAAAATLDLYQGTDTSGPRVALLGAGANLIDWDDTKGEGVIVSAAGLFASLAGAGADAVIYTG